MDVKVQLAQKWYNETYSNQDWYTRISEDGVTGQGTCRALCKALQHEIGLTSGIDGILGSASLKACPTVGPSTANTNLIKIIQSGFYCKGYECGDISGSYDGQTITAAQRFRRDAGFPTTDGTMPPLFIKALLNTDAYVLISGGKSYVREAQQYLNSHYFINMGSWGLIPCNGITDRYMMKGVIAALQYEEAGKVMTGVDGIYGNNTLNKAPQLSQGTTKSEYVKIAQMCLMCMMEVNAGIDGIFDTTLKAQVQTFQSHYCLTSASSGIVDRVTWASLLSSKGDSTRPALACDTSFQLNAAKAKSLYQDGYRYVGRYLSGYVGTGSNRRPKYLTRSELSTLFNAGLKVFAIFQEGAVTPTKFTNNLGIADANKAISTALTLGIPDGEIIYFALDCDMTDAQITSNAIPYFNGIKSAMTKRGNKYRIGIYGARNVCTRVTNAGVSISSFVSDMSTGFSGNLGYKIPDNWAFDQFHENKTYTTDGTTIALDKVAYSGRYNGFNKISDTPFLDIAKDTLSHLGIRATQNFELGKEVYNDHVKYYEKYLVGMTNTFDSKTDNHAYSPTLKISNGTFEINYTEVINTVLEQMDASMRAEFDRVNGPAYLSSLALNLGDANLKIGMKFTAGYLEIEFKISKTITIDDGTTSTLYYKINIGYRNIPTPTNQAQTETVLAAAGIALLAYFAAPAVLGEAVIIIESLMAELWIVLASFA